MDNTKVQVEMTPLKINQEFTFECNSQKSCFNQCCRGLNQALTPYDILRLRTKLGLGSADFLKQYTVESIGPESGLPIVMFKTQGECPLLQPSGCSVYEDRPSSCRMYPLVRLAARNRSTGKMREEYYLLREKHCLGFQTNQKQTLGPWLQSQEINTYNQMNDPLTQIIALKNTYKSGPLDHETRHKIYMALYDLDAFRLQVEKKIIDMPASINPDDNIELLQLGILWIKHILHS